MTQGVSYVTGSNYGQVDELPPTMGVREPRRPVPPTLSPGYALAPPTADEAATGEDPRVTECVAPR